jgi:hypothetical protein
MLARTADVVFSETAGNLAVDGANIVPSGGALLLREPGNATFYCVFARFAIREMEAIFSR